MCGVYQVVCMTYRTCFVKTLLVLTIVLYCSYYHNMQLYYVLCCLFSCNLCNQLYSYSNNNTCDSYVYTKGLPAVLRFRIRKKVKQKLHTQYTTHCCYSRFLQNDDFKNKIFKLLSIP